MKKVNWNKKIKEAFTRTEFMAISTSGKGGVWVNPVQYGYDKELNFYFISHLKSKHCQNLELNSDISMAIYSSERFPGEGKDVMGLQIRRILYQKEGNVKMCVSHSDLQNFLKS